MTTREALHRLIDKLPEHDLPRVERLLESWYTQDDPVLAALDAAPLDDEDETDEERAAVAEARRDAEQGDVFTLDEVRRELGM